MGGAVVNATMKSGTNDFHGTAYEFFRDTGLNATGYLFAPAPKPPLNRNQFGMSFGGPFIKNKLFFFTDYEGYRQRLDYINFDTIPDAPTTAPEFCRCLCTTTSLIRFIRRTLQFRSLY